jgi:hypothetical protein
MVELAFFSTYGMKNSNTNIVDVWFANAKLLYLACGYAAICL